MTHLNLVANELEKESFKTEIVESGIKVSLNWRKVNTIEIRIVLDEIFEEISFKVFTKGDSVLVILECDEIKVKDSSTLEQRRILEYLASLDWAS